MGGAVPENLNGGFILADGGQHPPEGRGDNHPRRHGQRRQKDEAKAQKLQLAVNPPPADGRLGDFVNAEGPSGHGPPVEKDIECDDGETEGHQDEHIIPEAVEYHAHHHGHSAGQQSAQGQGGKKGPGYGRYRFTPQLFVGGVGSQNGHRVGANAEKADVPHRKQPGVAHHQVEADGQDGPDGEHRSDAHGETRPLPEHKRRRPADDKQVGVPDNAGTSPGGRPFPNPFPVSRHRSASRRQSRAACRPSPASAPLVYLRGSRPRGQKDRNSASSMNEMASFHSPARSQMPNCSTSPSAKPPRMAP